MDSRALLEAVGWFGSLAVVASLMLPNPRRFRFWNLFGSALVAFYNLVLGVWPMVLMNTAIMTINAYWLWRLSRDASPAEIAAGNG